MPAVTQRSFVVVLATVCFAVLVVQTEAGGKYNVSFADLDKCLEFVADRGNTYHDYYEIEKLRNRSKSDDELVNVRLYILGGKDAHILLTNRTDPPPDFPVYEIVLGAGANTFSEIRRRRKHTPMVTVKRKQMLSAIEVLPVQIRITAAGFIEVTVANEETPLMRVFDQSLSKVTHIAFAGWGTTELKFFYDCHFDNSTDDNLELVVTKLSPVDNLKSLLYPKYDGNVTPAGLETVKITIKLFSYSFATTQSTLTVRSQIEMSWIDPKLRWNPDEFDGIAGFKSAEVTFLWSPSVYLLNGKGKQFLSLLQNTEMTVGFAGNITLRTRYVEFQTWCTDMGQNAKGMWPYDQVVCDIAVGSHSPDIQFQPASKWFMKMNNPSSADQSEWHLMDVALATNATIVGPGNSEPHLVYQLNMRRNSTLLARVFCTPLLIIHVILLASFWCEGSQRTGLIMIGYFVAAIMMLILMEFAPKNYVPRLVKYYELTLCLSFLAILLVVLDRCMEAYTTQRQPYGWITRCLASGSFRMIFGLDDPLRFDESTTKPGSPWTEIRQVIDRIAFGVFFVAFITGCSVGV